MFLLVQARGRVNQAVQQVVARQAQHDLLQQQKAKARTERDKQQQELQLFDEVQILLQQTSDLARAKAKDRIEEIVTQALTVVFDKDYKFTVELEVKGNQPVAEYFLTSDEVMTKLKGPSYGRGGGVIDVICLALRLAVGELVNVRGPLFMDEVGKHVSAEFQPNLGYFLKEYSKTFGRQIVLITHNAHLAEIGDVSIAVENKNGVARTAIIN